MSCIDVPSGVATSSSSSSSAAISSPPRELVTKFTNVYVLRHHRLVLDSLWVRGSTIIDPISRFWECAAAGAASRGDDCLADIIIDGGGRIACAGYIDLQLNGAFGIDFSNPDDMRNGARKHSVAVDSPATTPTSNASCSLSSSPASTSDAPIDNMSLVCRGVLRHGVTSIYATIISSSPSTYAQLRPLVKRRVGSATAGAHVLGVHLEGPFITVAGAHPKALIRGARKGESKYQNDELSREKAAPILVDDASTNASSSSSSTSNASPSLSSSSSSSLASAVSPYLHRSSLGHVDGLAEVCSVYGTDMSDVAIITLAPEIDGIMPVIRELSSGVRTSDATTSSITSSITSSSSSSIPSSSSPSLSLNRVVVSAGHSRASYSESMIAFSYGARLITHLFNAMVSFHHRDPGLIGLIGCKDVTDGAAEAGTEAIQSERSHSSSSSSSASLSPLPSSFLSPPPASLFYSIIVDGYHTHPASVLIAYKSHPRGCILITDAMLGLGLPDGSYRFGETDVDIAHNQAHVRGTDTLAGSIASMDECVEKFREFTGCTTVEAIEAATLHPAQCMRLDNKGCLDVGCDADIILLDESTMKVQGCWVMGEEAWRNEDAIKVTRVNKN